MPLGNKPTLTLRNCGRSLLLQEHRCNTFFLIKLKFLGCSVIQHLAISNTAMLTIFEQYEAWTWISLLYFQGPQEIAVVHCCCKNTSAILFFSYQTQMVTYERGSCEHCHQKCITFLSNSVVKIDAHLISQNNYFLRQFLYPYYLKRKSFILKKLQVWKLLFLMVPVGMRKNQWSSAYFGGEHISAVEWMVLIRHKALEIVTRYVSPSFKVA